MSTNWKTSAGTACAEVTRSGLSRLLRPSRAEAVPAASEGYAKAQAVWKAGEITKLLKMLQGRILARLLRGSAFVAGAAVLLSPPVTAAYATWPAALALFWLGGIALSWWLCARGYRSAAATAYVALTWLVFTVPSAFSGERFSVGNMVASLVIAALLLPWPGVTVIGLGSLALAAAAFVLDATPYAFPVLFPVSSYVRLAASLVHLSVVGIGLWILREELHAAVGSGVIETWARQEAEKAMQESEAKYRTLFARSIDASLVLDEDVLVDCNVAAVELFGVEKAKLIGTHPADWSPDRQWDGELSRSKATRLIAQALREGGARFEWTHRRADGSLLETEVSLTALQFNGRTVLHAVVRDATARIRTQEALRVSEAQLMATLQNTPNVAIQWYDADGRILFWNSASETMYGWAPAEAIGQTLDLLIYTPHEAARFRAVLEKIGASGKPDGPRERLVRRKDGSPAWIVETTFRIAMGRGKTGFACMHLDITDRVNAENSLAASEKHCRSVFESAMDCFLVVDPAGRLVDLNQQASTMLGYGREELLGSEIARVLDAHIADPHYPHAGEVLAKGHSVRGEQELRTKDGSMRFVEYVASPLPDGNVLAVVRDVSERRRAADSIRALNERLEERVAEQTAELRDAYRGLESFSYSVSHDLRAPVRAIIGFADLLRQQHGTTFVGEATRYLEYIEQNAKHMGRLIDDLLNFARAGSSECAKVPVEMRAIVEAAVSEQRQQWGERVQVEIGSLPAALGDPGLLRQVWSNLIGNAMKYSSKTAQPQISIWGMAIGDQVEFCVRDNGVGFDMAEAEGLFGAFQRLDSASEFEGSGIGLATVQRIVQRFGGTLRAQGRLGAGATFTFVLPDPDAIGSRRSTSLALPASELRTSAC